MGHLMGHEWVIMGHYNTRFVLYFVFSHLYYLFIIQRFTNVLFFPSIPVSFYTPHDTASHEPRLIRQTEPRTAHSDAPIPNALADADPGHSRMPIRRIIRRTRFATLGLRLGVAPKQGRGRGIKRDD
jgi:hypothetical protein